MKNHLVVLIFFMSILSASVKAQDIFTDTKMKVSFFSETPIEDIDARSSECSAALNIKSKEVYATIRIKSFGFKRELMQEHFNTDYLESDKYPDGSFKGSVIDNIDFTKAGTYKANVSGKLTIHGVGVDRTIPVTITVNGNQITLHSEFMVHIADHKITIPTLVVQHVAEDVKVTVDGTLNPYSGK